MIAKSPGLNQSADHLSRKQAIWYLSGLSTLIGLYISFKVTTGIFGIDNDSVAPLLAWSGLQQHGLSFLTHWLFTPDNWLLSLFPLAFVQFYLFGPYPYLPIIDGWLISVLAAFLSGIIAWQLNAKRAACIIPPVLLVLGFYAQRYGFASYSVSHNITNLFGLSSYALCLSWLRRPRNIYLLAIFILLTTASISDPWMVPAYTIPIITLAGILPLTSPKTLGRRQALKLLATATLSIIFFKTECLGLLNFLPAENFTFGNFAQMRVNAIFLIKDLGALLNMVPFRQSNEMPWSILSLAICTALLPELWNPASRPFLLMAFASMAMTCLLFILTNVPATQESGRFLLNCAYLLPIAIGVLSELNWAAFTKTRKAFLCFGVLLFTIANISSTHTLWRQSRFTTIDNGERGLISFLNANNLSYGYGPYWGTQGNAITAMTNGAIRIRPVIFDAATGMMITGNRRQVSTYWYTPADAGPAQKDYFVYVAADGEECPDKNLCLQGLSKQFGPPDRSLQYGLATIMVWNHLLPAAVTMPPPAPPLPPAVSAHFIQRETVHVCQIRAVAQHLHLPPTPMLRLYGAYIHPPVPAETIICPP